MAGNIYTASVSGGSSNSAPSTPATFEFDEHEYFTEATGPNGGEDSYIEEAPYSSANESSSSVHYGSNVFNFPGEEGMGALSSRRNRKMFFMAEMQRYDGWYNNLAHPRWGSTGKLRLSC